MITAQLPLDQIKPYERNARVISEEAIQKVMTSIKLYGYNSPIIVDANYVIIAGHTRLRALQRLGYTSIAVTVADNLTPQEVKAYRLADNRVAQETKWNYDLLAEELGEFTLTEEDLCHFTGFDADDLAFIKGSDDDMSIEDELGQSDSLSEQEELVIALPRVEMEEVRSILGKIHKDPSQAVLDLCRQQR